MNKSETCMYFSHKTGELKEIPYLLGAAVAKAHHVIHSFSSAVMSKPRRSLKSSDLVSNITVLPDQDDQCSEQPIKLDA